MSINKITAEDITLFEEVRAEEDIQNGTNLLDLFQQTATKSAIYPGQGSPLGLLYVSLKGAGEAGEFAEHVGKAMRDDGFMTSQIREIRDELTIDRRELLIKEVGDQLWYLAAKCNELGIKLSEAALINLIKLKDRCDRDVLQGSGDDR